MENHDQTENDVADVFFGDITLDEVKKHIFTNPHRQTVPCDLVSSDDELNSSLKIIEVHSTPNILNVDYVNPPVTNKTRSSPDLSFEISTAKINDSNESFLKLEKLVTDLLLSPRNEQKEISQDRSLEVELCSNNDYASSDLSKTKANPEEKIVFNLEDHLKPVTPIAQLNKDDKDSHPITNFLAISPHSDSKQNIFKTPAVSTSHKKNMQTPKRKIPQFQNVVSPVAYYIKNSPVPALVKNVHPKKPIQGSAIPKPVKHTPGTSKGNKENINLPQIAYRSAKETKMINLPQNQKLPHSQWSKQVASSIPKAVVIKHNHRENTSTKKEKQHESSFSNLTLQQADLSVCTQKSAFK